MSTANEKILQDEVKELNVQLYAGYTRIMGLLNEIKSLNTKIADQQDVIDALAESASGRDRKSDR